MQAVAQFLADEQGVLQGVNAGQHDQDLVPADPGDDVTVAHDAPDPTGRLDQQGVPRGMAQRVVDLLERVDVAERHGDRYTAFAGQQNPQPGERLIPVEQSRQLIGASPPVEFGQRLHLGLDVTAPTNEVHDAVGAGDHAQVGFDPAGMTGAVEQSQPHRGAQSVPGLAERGEPGFPVDWRDEVDDVAAQVGLRRSAKDRGHSLRNPLDDAVQVEPEDHVRGVLGEQAVALLGIGDELGGLLALRHVAHGQAEVVTDPHCPDVESPDDVWMSRTDEDGRVLDQCLAGLDRSGELVDERLTVPWHPLQCDVEDLLACDARMGQCSIVGFLEAKVDDFPRVIPDGADQEVRVDHRVHDGLQPSAVGLRGGLAAAILRLRVAQRLFDLHLSRDVDDLCHQIARPPSLIAHARHRDVPPDDRLIRTQEPLQQPVGVPPAGQDVIDQRDVSVQIARVGQGLPGGVAQGHLVAVEQLAQRLVDSQELTGGGDQTHADGRVLHRIAEAVFGLT